MASSYRMRFRRHHRANNLELQYQCELPKQLRRKLLGAQTDLFSSRVEGAPLELDSASQDQEGCSDGNDEYGHAKGQPKVLTRMPHVAHNAAPIVRCDYGQQPVTDGPTQEHRKEKLAHPVSECAGSQ